MTADYSLTTSSDIIHRNTDGADIPNDPDNVDWQAYQVWLDDNNTPDPYLPPPPTIQQQYDAVILAGLGVTFNSTPDLSATYAIDQASQFNITAEMVSILTNATFGTGQVTRLWADLSGSFHEFNIDQFKAFATAVSLYTNGLFQTLHFLQIGQFAPWPSNQVAVDA